MSYEGRFQLVRGIINRHDPAKLLTDRKSPETDDEYDSEVKGTLKVMERAADERALAYLLRELFGGMLGKSTSDMCDWNALAADLWAARQQNGWEGQPRRR